MAQAILDLAENKQDYAEIKENAVELSKRFDREVIARRTEDILNAIDRDQALPEISW